VFSSERVSRSVDWATPARDDMKSELLESLTG
jgi:hypothetical protein